MHSNNKYLKLQCIKYSYTLFNITRKMHLYFLNESKVDMILLKKHFSVHYKEHLFMITGELGYDGLNMTRKIGPSYAKSVVYI